MPVVELFGGHLDGARVAVADGQRSYLVPVRPAPPAISGAARLGEQMTAAGEIRAHVWRYDGTATRSGVRRFRFQPAETVA